MLEQIEIDAAVPEALCVVAVPFEHGAMSQAQGRATFEIRAKFRNPEQLSNLSEQTDGNGDSPSSPSTWTKPGRVVHGAAPKGSQIFKGQTNESEDSPS
jgi:hypothetical protein